MDDHAVATLMSTVDLMSTNLDVAPDSWRHYLPAVRNVTATLDFSDTVQDATRKAWQLPLLSVFQRVAYADADSGGSGLFDIADWCLRQTLTLLQVYPEDVTLLTLIGRCWLLRAQIPLAKIHQTERSSTSSGGSLGCPQSSGEDQRQAATSTPEAEHRLHTSEYVEARGLLLPAVEYLKRAVDAAGAQNNIGGSLLVTAAEAYMSLGNVSSFRMNEPYFQAALSYLRTAGQISGYSLPTHLQLYLDEYGPIILG